MQTSERLIKYLCPICSEARFRVRNFQDFERSDVIRDQEMHRACREEEDRRFDEADDRRRADERIEAFYRASNLPVELVKLRTFEAYSVTPENKRAVDTIRSWVPGDKWGVMLYGKAGVGKSHLMLAFANRWIPEHVNVFFKSTSTLFDELRAGYENGKFQGLLDDVCKRQVLVMDDIGAEKPTPWVEEKLFQILDYRLNHGLPTFFTTNCSPTTMKGNFHERITSRLKELAVVVEVGGEDRRNRHYEQRMVEIQKRIAKREEATA